MSENTNRFIKLKPLSRVTKQHSGGREFSRVFPAKEHSSRDLAQSETSTPSDILDGSNPWSRDCIVLPWKEKTDPRVIGCGSYEPGRQPPMRNLPRWGYEAVCLDQRSMAGAWFCGTGRFPRRSSLLYFKYRFYRFFLGALFAHDRCSFFLYIF